MQLNTTSGTDHAWLQGRPRNGSDISFAEVSPKFLRFQALLGEGNRLGSYKREEKQEEKNIPRTGLEPGIVIRE